MRPQRQDEDDVAYESSEDEEKEAFMEEERTRKRLQREWLAAEPRHREEAERKKREALTKHKGGQKNADVGQIFSSDAAKQMLVNDLLDVRKHEGETGMSAVPVDDNIYEWVVKFKNFEGESQLARDLHVIQERFGYDFVELHMSFTHDLFPFYPPMVTVTRPRLAGFMMGRVTSMETLQLDYWDPILKARPVAPSPNLTLLPPAVCCVCFLFLRVEWFTF